MNLQDARKKLPELSGLSDESALNVIHQVYYPHLDKADLSQRLGVKMPEAPLPERSMARAIGDGALGLGQGAIGAFKAISDVVGADNVVSRGLGAAGEAVQDLKSDRSKAILQNSQARVKAAEESGDTLEEAKAYMGMFWDQPFEMIAQGAGSFATMGLGKIAQGLKLARAAKASGMSKKDFLESAAGKQAIKEAADFGFKANIGVGAAQGVGAVKGSQYEQTFNNAREQGMSEEDAAALATQAQSYGGAGTMQQVLGGGLGALAAGTGPIERLIAGKSAGNAVDGMAASVAKGFGKEFATEGAQGAQERFAGNEAAIDSGVLAPEAAMRGVVGQGLMEGTIGGILGGGAGVFTGGAPQALPDVPATTPGQDVANTIRAESLVAESGPMTRAANAGTEAKAQQAEAEIDASVQNASLTGTSMADMLRGQTDPLQGAMQAQANPTAEDSSAVAAPAADQLPDAGNMVPDQSEQPLDMVPQGVDPATGEVIQPAPKPNPLDFTGKTDEELQEFRKNAQDPSIRKALATELQARKAAKLVDGNLVPVADKPATLPKNLAGAKPNYSYGAKKFTLSFDSDIDRAAYITAQGKPSPKDAEYLKFAMDATGMTDAQVRAHGQKVKDGIKAQAKDAEPGALKVAKVEYAKPAAQDVTLTNEGKTDAPDQKTRWLKAINDENRLTGDTGVQLSVTDDGKLTYLGDPNSTQSGRRLLKVVDEARKAGATSEDIAASIRAAKPITSETGKPTEAAPVQAPAVTAEAADTPSSKYQSLTNEWNAKVQEYKAATPEQQKAMQAEMDELKARLEQGRQGVVAESFSSFKEQQKKQAQKDRAENDRKYGGMTIGTRIGMPEHANDDSIYWEKTGDNEWSRTGIGSERPTKTNAEMFGSRVIQQPATSGVPEAGAGATQPPKAAPAPSEAQEQWTRSTTNDRIAIARAGGIVLKAAENVARKGWAEHDPVVQEKLARGIAKRGQTEPANVETDDTTAKRVDETPKKEQVDDPAWTGAQKVLNGMLDPAKSTPLDDLDPATHEVDIGFLKKLHNKVRDVDFGKDKDSIERKKKRIGYLLAAIQEKEEGRGGIGPRPSKTTTDTVLGQNENGQTLMVDAKGVRYYKDGNFKVSEPVRLRPTREGVETDVVNRRDEFKTVAELEAEKPAIEQSIQPALEAAGWTAEVAGADNTIWTKTDAGNRYTARLTPATGNKPANMEITVLVDAMDTQIASFGVTDAKAATERAEKAVADDKAEQAPEVKPDPAKPARLPEAVQEAIENQLRKQRARIARLTREAGAADLTLEQKLAAQTKVKAAEATQRKLRTDIFEAEDAAEAAISAKDAALFAPHADLFPDAAAEIQKALGQNDELDAEMRSYEAKADKPAAKPATKPADPDAAAKAKAQQDLDDALGELGMILTKGIRKNMMPEQERALLPVLTQVMDASFRLGYYKFKESARFVLDKVRAKFGGEVADMITLDHLQGAYIGMAGKYQADGASTKKEVIAIESLDELADTVANEPTTGENPPQTPRTEQEANNEPKIPQDGQRPLDETPATNGGEAAKAGDSGGDTAAGSKAGDRAGGGTDAAGVQAPRSGGSRSRRISDPAARPKRVGGRRGTDAAGAAVPGVDAGATGDNADGVNDLFAQPEATAETSSTPNIPAANFKIEEGLALGEGGEVAKFKDNIAAIRTLKAIEADKRRATPEEQRTLARFVGWGGLANAFPNPETGQFKAGWEKRGQEVQDLLTPSEIRAASRSTRNAHYTSPTVVKAMWSMAHRMGFRDGLALESSMGVGNFLGLMPSNVAARFIGVEYDSLTARIAAALYPQATVLESGFQKVPLPDNAFDLSIGNPPFGDESLRFQYRPELNGDSIHNQFFRASLAALKPERLHIQVVSRYLMDRQDKKARIALARDADLVAAIRLPDNAFKENARTEVVTDIIILKKRTPADKARMDAILDAYIAPKEKNADKERERRQLADQAPKWLDTAEIKDPLGGENMVVNRYFQDNPGQIVGTMERSGSMRYKNDVTVRLDDVKELESRLNQLVEKLPKDIVSTADDVAANTENAYKVLGEALSMAVAREEVGHIKTDADGKMTRAVERDFEGEQVLTRQEVSASSPWSRQLSMDNLGRWYRLDVRMDAQGKPVKALDKDGKPTRANSFVRTTYSTEAEVPSTLRLGEMGFAKLKEVVALRDMLKRQLVLETEDSTKEMMEDNRQKLAQAYRAFVEKFGPVNRLANARLVADMPDAGLIFSLESEYEPARTKEQAAKSGLPEQAERVREAPILSERVVPKYEPPTAADTPADALAITLAERGVVNMDHIAALLGMTPEQAEAELTGGEKPLVFKDPETNSFETANAYLSGQVRRKLMAAKSAGLTENVKALEAVQPERWSAENVSVQVGSTWVPPDVYADFLSGLIGGDVTVTFSPLTNTFGVTAKNSNATKNDAWSSEGATASWIFGRMLNSQTPTITYTDSEGKVHTNKEATSLAILKSREFVTEFQDWIFKDGERRERLVEIFNEKFNTRVTRQYDGSHLKLPGKVPDSIIEMRRHQMNAIWRGISSKFLLIDHAVGAGKTFTGIARAMERRRMGLAQKPAFVVPNHLVEQWQAAVYALYPGAKLLAAGKADFEKKNRRKLFGRIATGDYDIVILPHSAMVKIGISPETEQRYLEQELKDALEAVRDAEEQAKEDGHEGFRKPMGVKEAERLVTKIQTRMDKLSERATDRLLTFEQLGIDDLTVDEAHEFKNLFYSSRLTKVRGMGDKTGSGKAADLYNKVRVLRDNGGAVVFMTGTPVSNSVVELYTMMRYLAANELRESGMEHFDAWRTQFVDAEPAFEPDESNRLKEVTRLGRSWSNMRSMMDLYYQFTDAVSLDDIKQWYSEDNGGKPFPVPKVKGGERQLVKMQPTPAQESMLKEVIAGFDGLEGIKDTMERNAERLRLMDRARKLSLDVRAAAPGSTSPEKGGKLERVSAEVKRIYDKTTGDRGTQLIFLDRSVPKAKGDDKLIKEYDELMAKRDKAMAEDDDAKFKEINEALEKFDANEITELRNAQNGGWNAYQQIKDNLIASGIPADQIRFVQEANTDEQKQALFDAVNGGKVRVLIGSTPRMGAGTNVQKRLVGLHHVDVTWKPSDIEQREGRIVRQGNELLTKYGPDFEVEVLAYATERTVDAKMWSLNATKLKAINGLRKYTGDFSMEVEDEESVSMAEMAALASGNPLLLERVTLESAINGLELQEKAFRRKMYGAQDALESAEKVINTYPEMIKQSRDQAKVLAERVQAVSNAADKRRVTVEGQEFDGYKDALKKALAAVELQQEGNENGRYAININGERVTSKAGIEDAIGQALGDDAAFEVEIGGESINQRTRAGRELSAILSPKAQETDGRGEGTIGKMFGYDLVYQFQPNRFDKAKVDLVLALENGGKTVAAADVSGHDPMIKFTTPQLRDALGNMAAEVESKASGQSANYMERRLEAAESDIDTLRKRVNETFPKTEEIKEKRARLKRVIALLSSDATEEVESDAAVSTNIKQTGAPEANETDVVFSRGTGKGIDVATAQSVVDGIKARWANAPEVVVVQGMQDKDVPEAVRNADAQQRSQGAEGEPEGFFYEGKAYIVAGALRSPGAVMRVLFHEVLGHAGLRGTFGDGLKPILKQLAALRRGDVAAKAKQYGLDMSKESDRLQAAEEVLAEMAQTKPEMGYVKRAIAAIRAFLRKNVPGFQNMKLTDADIIANYILPARAFVERGPGGGGPKGGLSLSRSTDDGAMFSRSLTAPALAGQVRDKLFDVSGATGNTLAHYRGMALQTLGRRQLVDLYGDMLPQLKKYDELVQRMDAEKNDSAAEADAIANEWGKLDEKPLIGPAKNPGMERKLAELMHDATLAQMDPDKPLQDGDNPAQHAELKAKFAALSPQAQSVYRRARDMYEDHYAKVREAIQDRIMRSELGASDKKSMIARMDEDFFQKTKGVYFPLARFGKYVMVVKDADGKTVNVSRAETLNEAETTRKMLLREFDKAKGFNVTKVMKEAEFNRNQDMVGKGFVTDLFAVLDKQGVDAELRDSVSQLYLSSLPDLSWAKHGIHRKGTPGFSQDARRAFAQNVFHGARYLAKLRYSDQLQNEITGMGDHIKVYEGVDEYDGVKAQQVLDEMAKRHDNLMSPDGNPVSTALTSVGFVYFLGLSPAAAAVNLSQTALVAYPVMGAKWGYDKAASALLLASKQTVMAKNDISQALKGDELDAYNRAVSDGTIDVTMAHDLAGISQGEDAKVTWALRPVMRVASFLFHQAERFNRQATFIAAYRLAKDAGAGKEAAFEQAKKATYDGHFDYGSSNRPRIMQGNVAKVVLLFKQYGQNMVYTMSRQAYLATNSLNPKEKAEARKQLAGILALHAAAAGVLGLPLVGALLTAASFLGSDDDEPWDAEVAMKNAMADAMGPKAAEVMAHGLSRLTPWDISGRVALDKLILPDVQEGLEGQKWAEKMMVAAVGPVGGIFTGAAKGLQSMSEGKYQRGLEEMLPIALRNPIKAARYYEEGAVDRSGVAIKDEVSMAGVLGQASGFAPSEVRAATEVKSAIFRHDRARMDRRSTLMSQFAQAQMAGDTEGMAEVRQMIAKFNEKNPRIRILPRNLYQSVRNREKRIREAEQGVYLPKNRRDALEAVRFGEASQ